MSRREKLCNKQEGRNFTLEERYLLIYQNANERSFCTHKHTRRMSFKSLFLFGIIDTKRKTMRRRRWKKYNFMNVTMFLMMVFIKKCFEDANTREKGREGKNPALCEWKLFCAARRKEVLELQTSTISFVLQHRKHESCVDLITSPRTSNANMQRALSIPLQVHNLINDARHIAEWETSPCFMFLLFELNAFAHFNYHLFLRCFSHSQGDVTYSGCADVKQIKKISSLSLRATFSWTCININTILRLSASYI